MLRIMTFSLVALLLAAGAGCSEEQFNEFFKVLDAVAPQLLAVQADPASFPPEDHPLRAPETGTVIDGPSKLTGVWGRFTTHTSEDPKTGAITVRETATILEIDVADGTMIQHQLSQCTQGPNCLFGDNAQRAIRLEFTIAVASDNLLVVRSGSGAGRGGIIAGNGEPVFDFTTLLSAVGRDDQQFWILFTVQGDFLNTQDGCCTPDEIIAFNVENNNDPRLWVRIAP